MARTLNVESFEELQLLTEALLAVRADRDGEPEPSEDLDEDRQEVEELDPLIDKILSQAESGGIAPYVVDLDETEADRVSEALEFCLDAAADSGDVFRTAEIEGLMRRLGRG